MGCRGRCALWTSVNSRVDSKQKVLHRGTVCAVGNLHVPIMLQQNTQNTGKASRGKGREPEVVVRT